MGSRAGWGRVGVVVVAVVIAGVGLAGCVLTNVVQVAVGTTHSCALLSDGTVRCAGSNDRGQLGDGSQDGDHATPVAVSGLGDVTSLAAGSDHTCAVVGDGTVRCWGGNGSGQLGDGTTTTRRTPVTVVGLTDVARLTMGVAHTCALHTDGTVSCWGANDAGQLGDGTTVARATPAAAAAMSGVTSIGAGTSHTCALLGDGTVGCWGSNAAGQLGDGSTSTRLAPVAVSGLSGVTGLGVGGQEGCAVLAGGTVQCWGDNSTGQIGDGTTTSRPTPVAVTGITGASAAVVGGSHACALLTDGTARCWGGNAKGQLGDGTTADRTTPVAVAGLNRVTELGAGDRNTCARLSGATARCWGDNARGQIGDGTTTSRLGPAMVVSAPDAAGDIAQIGAGEDHTCALRTDGTVICWGANGYGQLGNGVFEYNGHPSPVVVSGITTATAIAVGNNHSCALLADGSVRCWGANASAQLGDGSTTGSALPVTATSLFGPVAFVAVGAGDNNTCAQSDIGFLWCWGENSFGQLNTPGNRVFNPTPVLSADVSSIAGGSNFTCVFRPDAFVFDRVTCAGSNGWSQIGVSDDRGLNFGFGIPIGATSGFTSVSAGGEHACGRVADGTAECWGDSRYGALGDGIDRSSAVATPVRVLGLTGVVDVAAGADHSCAVLTDGSVRCWGLDDNSQVGGDRLTGYYQVAPVTVAGVTDAISVAAGPTHTCAVLSDHTARCWGDNGFGKLGSGRPGAPTATPVTVITP